MIYIFQLFCQAVGIAVAYVAMVVETIADDPRKLPRMTRLFWTYLRQHHRFGG